MITYLGALAVPVAWAMAWAWTAPRSTFLRTEAALASVVGVPLGALLTLVVLGMLYPADPDDSYAVVRSLEGALLVPLPLAVWASVTFGSVLAVLGGRQGRPLTPPARRAVTRPLVVGFAVALFAALLAAAYFSGPLPIVYRGL